MSASARWPDGATPADVLAAVAARLGAPWDGPGDAGAVDVEIPAGVPGWEVLGATREALADPGLAAHHTPGDVARRLTRLALEGCGAGAVVADPACGAGAFLVAAAEHLAASGADRRRVVEHQLAGADVDALAVASARAALALWSGCGARAGGVVVADGLTAWRPPGSVDAVVGNPPFGTRSGRLAPYTDLAGRFLVAALDLVDRGGPVLLVQPESVLAARDAAPVRAAVGDDLAGLWVAGETVFGADVRVCAPLVRAGSRRVRRWRGAAVRDAGSVDRDPAAPTWSYLRPAAPPAARHGERTVGDLATAAAGWRDQFYALADAVAEGRGHPLVTSGLIDAGHLAWGERPARVGGRRYDKPAVDPALLDGRIRAWVDARLQPKVLVATQTRVVEAAPDPDGQTIPMTPVISVHPHAPDDTWRIAAALTAPAATAWALRHYGGAGLHGDAVKLAAGQVLAIPLPDDDAAWDRATEALRRGDVLGCATALADDADLLAWWRARWQLTRHRR
jgi:predicted RNA methylase